MTPIPIPADERRAAMERLRTFAWRVPEGLFTACGHAYHDVETADGARVKLGDDLAMVLVALAKADAILASEPAREEPYISGWMTDMFKDGWRRDPATGKVHNVIDPTLEWTGKAAPPSPGDPHAG